MSFAVTKKLFPLCSLLALLVSCGKKVQEGTPMDMRRAGLSLPRIVSLEASASGSFTRTDGIYKIPRDGNIELPTTVNASTMTGPHRLRLDVNLLDDEDEFHCYWAGKGTFYEFESCQDVEGTDLGLTLENVSKFTFPIDQGKKLKLRLEAAPGSSTVKSYLELAVTWI